MQMNTEQKIRCWAPVWRKLHEVEKISKHIIDKIPLKIRKDIYIRTVVKGLEKYHAALKTYAKKHGLIK